MTRFTITSLNEAVRLYVRARYINEGLGPGGTKSISTDVETIAFGETSQATLGKRARKRKQASEKKTELEPGLKKSLYGDVLTFTGDELASLHSRAVQALGHARKQLGASAHYCGAMIRLEDDCDGSCKDNPIYKEVNDV